jgi:hypothetical protein
MATYYVSQQNGDDSWDGTTPTPGAPDGPWATLAHAYATMAAGDTIHVGPGTYREPITVSKNCYWYGDPECKQLTSDHPGPVRWTAADVNDISQSTPAIDITSGTVTASHMTLDGCDSATQGTVDKATYSATVVLSECVIAGNIAARGVLLNRCIVFGGAYGLYNCRYGSCIVMAGGYAVYEPVTLSNGGLLFGRYGAYVTGASITLRNTIAHGCEIGFYGSGANPTWENCHAAYCQTGYYEGTRTACLYSGCQAATGGGGGSGTPTESGVVFMSDFDSLRRAFRAHGSLSGLMNVGSATVNTPDIMLLSRDAQCNDIGPYVLPNDRLSWDAGDYYSDPPGIVLQAPGQGRKLIQIAAKAGVLLTVKVWTKHDGATSKPSIQLRQKGTVFGGASDTNVSDAGVWEQLVVSATPTNTDTLELALFNNEDATYSAWFSDFEVT